MKLIDTQVGTKKCDAKECRKNPHKNNFRPGAENAKTCTKKCMCIFLHPAQTKKSPQVWGVSEMPLQGCTNLKVQCAGAQSSIQFNVTSSKLNSKFNVGAAAKKVKVQFNVFKKRWKLKIMLDRFRKVGYTAQAGTPAGFALLPVMG